jgi:hypothetical protein
LRHLRETDRQSFVQHIAAASRALALQPIRIGAGSGQVGQLYELCSVVCMAIKTPNSYPRVNPDCVATMAYIQRIGALTR